MRRLQILSAWLGIVAVSAGAAFGQEAGATTGAINGKVSDATGGIMTVAKSG